MSQHHETISHNPPPNFDENSLDSMNNVVTRLPDIKNSSCVKVKIMECMASIPESSDETDYNSTITIGDEVSFGTSKKIFRNSTVILTSNSIFGDCASEMPTKNSSVKSSNCNETTVLPKSLNPSSDSGDHPVVAISNSVTIEIPEKLPSSIPQFDYDDNRTTYSMTSNESSYEGNSDVTVVIGDNISVDTTSVSIASQMENSRPMVMHVLHNDFASSSSNPRRNEERNFVVPTSNITNNFNIFYPQQTSISNRTETPPSEIDWNYIRYRPEINRVTHRYRRCDLNEIISWFLSLVFLAGLLLYLVLYHPDSKVVWITLVALIITVIGGVISFLLYFFQRC